MKDDGDREQLRKRLEANGFYDVLIHLHLQDHDGACFCTTEISGAYNRLLDVVEAERSKAVLEARLEAFNQVRRFGDTNGYDLVKDYLKGAIPTIEAQIAQQGPNNAK